jgi:hypothetical protein
MARECFYLREGQSGMGAAETLPDPGEMGKIICFGIKQEK